MTETASLAQYIPVRLNTLRKGDSVQFDVFIKVGARHIHYIRQNDPFDGDRIESLKSKGVQKLFIPLDHETAYLNYLDAGLHRLEDKSANLETKAEIAHTSLMNISGYAEQCLHDESKYRDMESRVQKIMSFIGSEKGIGTQILKQSGFAQDDMQHAANVSTLSLMLAAKRGITEPKDLLSLSLAALMHDIGLVNLGIDTSIPRDKLSTQELAKYQSHPRAGADLMRDKAFVNPTIISLIQNHEEMGEGAGFPEKKRISTLPPLQQILNLCNEYDRMCRLNKLHPAAAIKDFLLNRVGLFPLDLIQALSAGLKVS